MELFKYVVRQDWQELNRLVSSSRSHLWRAAQITALVSTLLVYTSALARLPQPWSAVLQIVLSSTVFLTFSLWVILQNERHNRLAAVLAAGMLLAAGWAAAVSRPWMNAQGVFEAGLWPSHFAGFSVVLSWGSCLLGLRLCPEEMRLIGFTTRRWPAQVLLGLGAGGSLGLHFLITANQWLNGGLQAGSPQQILWVLLFLAGLGALGEEFFLRGIAFRVLYEESETGFWRAAVHISLINLLIYFVPLYFLVSSGMAPLMGLWILIYRLVYSLAATYLRRQQFSLLACIAFNLAFNGILMVFFPW